MALIAAMSMALTTGAATARPSGSASIYQANAAHSEVEIDRILDSVPPDASIEEAARIIYPSDPVGQAEYIDLAHEIDRAASASQNSQDRVLPVLVARLIPVLVKCVKGAVVGIPGAEVGSAVWGQDHATTQEMVEGAISGCIMAVVPAPVRAAAQAAKPHIVAAITAIIIRLSRP